MPLYERTPIGSKLMSIGDQMGGGEVPFKAKDALQSIDSEGTGLELLPRASRHVGPFQSGQKLGSNVAVHFGDVSTCVS